MSLTMYLRWTDVCRRSELLRAYIIDSKLPNYFFMRIKNESYWGYNFIFITNTHVGMCDHCAGAGRSRKSHGKNIQEAYKTFGNPWLTGIETNVAPESKFYGHKWYFFESRVRNYDEQKLVGSYMDTSSGHLQHVEQYETQHKRDACSIGFWADAKTNIIDYYQVKGNCDWGGIGFGQTLW